MANQFKKTLGNSFSAKTSDTTVTVNGAAKNVSFLGSTTAALTTDPASSVGLETFNNSSIDPTSVYFLKGRGSKDAPLPVSFGDGVANLVFGATNSNGEMKTDGAFFRVEAGTGTATAMPLNMFFGVQNLDSGASTAAIMTPGFIDFGAIGDTGTFNITGSSKINLITPDLQLNGGSLTGKFSQTADKTVENSAVATSIFGTGSGSQTIAANILKAGDAFTIKVGGELRTDGIGESLQIRLSDGINTLADSGPITLSSTTALSFFEIEIDFVIRSIGAAGVASIYSNGQLTYLSTVAGGDYEGGGINSSETTNFDTTVSNTFDITVQWGAASALNVITSHVGVFHKTY